MFVVCCLVFVTCVCFFVDGGRRRAIVMCVICFVDVVECLFGGLCFCLIVVCCYSCDGRKLLYVVLFMCGCLSFLVWGVFGVVCVCL